MGQKNDNTVMYILIPKQERDKSGGCPARVKQQKDGRKPLLTQSYLGKAYFCFTVRWPQMVVIKTSCPCHLLIYMQGSTSDVRVVHQHKICCKEKGRLLQISPLGIFGDKSKRSRAKG